MIIITDNASAIGSAAFLLSASQGANVIIADILKADAKRVTTEMT